MGWFVIDGQDADIVRYLERFGEEPPVPSRAHDDTPETVLVGTQWARRAIRRRSRTSRNARDQDFRGGDDGTRTHDPLLAKQVL